MSRLAEGIDTALEWSVFGSFTRIGTAARRRAEGWSAVNADLRGRVVVITGGTSGLGFEAARALAAMGATVEIVARDEARAAAACARIAAETANAQVGFVLADTGDLDAVRRAAAALLARHPAIHVLIHNAGALDDRWQASPQGIEATVASQVVGPFLLTELLLPALRKATPARVLWVSSGGMYSEPLAVDQLEMAPTAYDGTTAYARAKRAQVTLAALSAERLAPDGIEVQSMHPGWADTPGVARSLPLFRRLVGPFLRTAEEGEDTLVWLAASGAEPVREGGQFWHDRRPRALHRFASTRRSDTPEERARMWQWTREKAGLAP